MYKRQYGVSVLSDCKYGWDKPQDNMLRLTCIHTPAGAFTKDARQDLQDIGRNIFSFGIFSHKGALSTPTQVQAQCFNEGLVAFRTSSSKQGSLGDSFSLLKTASDSVIVRAVKQSYDGDGVVVRVNEACGKEHKDTGIKFFCDISSAEEVYADEKPIKDAKIIDGALVFDLKPFEVKTFKLKLNSIRNKAKENYKKLDLPFNSTGITKDSYKVNCILQGSGMSLPDELIPESLTVSGVTFKMPNADMDKNVLIPRGQEIEIPKGVTKLYMIAASVLEDKKVVFMADNKERELTVYDMKAPVGKWDMKGLEQFAEVKRGALALEFTHTHHPEGNIANGKAYFYLYEIDVRGCKTLTLPEENKMVILAMTGVKKFSNTYLSTELIDYPSEDYKPGEISPIEKIIDKADFISIRAGKIQDQINGGKGKGFKRDNIITNIIRSYTKSEW